MQVIDQDDLLPVSITRQRSAFPPNYVHSLDSTHVCTLNCHVSPRRCFSPHFGSTKLRECERLLMSPLLSLVLPWWAQMMMTAIECKKRGITFTAVHDSYWTHACDVDTMSTALRDQFVELYVHLPSHRTCARSPT